MSGTGENGLVATLAPDTVRDAVRVGREKIVATADVHFVAVDEVATLVDALRSPVPIESSLPVSTAPLHQLGDCQVRRVPTRLDRGMIVDHWRVLEDHSHMVRRFSHVPGVIAPGWLDSRLVSKILVAFGDTIRSTTSGGPNAL